MRLGMVRERQMSFSLALKQAIEMLQMPQTELALWLQQEVEKNPLLELPEPKGAKPIDEIAYRPSLYEYLCHQIKEVFLDPSEQTIAEILVGFLDEKGFLSTPLEEISALFPYPIETLTYILKKIQSFDPAGIGARNLQECLSLQLKRKSPCIAQKIVEGHFDDLLHGRYAKLKKTLQIGPHEFAAAIDTLAKLNLRPASGFERQMASIKTADLRAVKSDDKWAIEIIDDEFPPIQIRQDVASLISKMAADEKKSIKAWLIAAKWLKRSLCRRNHLLATAAEHLLNRQEENLEPITSQELAERLQVHESTIHRVLSEKMIELPCGIVSLRSLLSQKAAVNHHKHILQNLITQENKAKPLTDEELSSLLQLKGIALARRTVAKYRKELKLPAASRRKLSL